MRIAAIDVGTNTAMLLVAEVTADGALVPLVDARRFIRLGESVDAARRVGPAAMQRLRTALLEYRDVAREYDAAEIVIGATSASRDARNQAELIDNDPADQRCRDAIARGARRSRGLGLG